MSGRLHRALAGLLLASALLSTPSSAAPAAENLALEEVLARHREARGGVESWARLRTMTFRGDFTSFSEPRPFTLRLKKGGKIHLVRYLNALEVVIASDGERPWWIHRLYGFEWPQRMGGTEVDVLAQHADFATPFFHLEEEGHEVELLGRGDLDGQEVIRLRLKRRSGAEETWYLDPETYLEVARDAVATDFGEVLPARTFFSDFRELGGLKVPHRIESEFGTRYRLFEISEVELDFPIEDEVFTMPVPEGMEALQALAGTWEVAIETPLFPGGPPTNLDTRSEIRAVLSRGVLEEEVAYRTPIGQPRRERRLWSYDRFRERYQLLVTSDYSWHMNLLEGAFEDGRLAVDNLGTDTGWRAGDETYHDRYTLRDLGPDGFVLEHETSTDAGETWTTAATWTYRRPSG